MDSDFVSVDTAGDQILIGHSKARTVMVVDASWNKNENLELTSDTD